jgi:hypothetical protein
MRYFFLIIGFMSVIILSCDKAKVADLPDKIVYVDLTPDLVLHPVDSVGLHPSGFCDEFIPFPTDSIQKVDLDMNQDGVNDFRFTYTTFYESVSGSNPCANYNSTLEVKGLSAENNIRVKNLNMDEVCVFQMGDLINSNQLFSNNAVIFRDNATSFLNYSDFSGEGFIGVKFSGGELAWIKLDFQKNSFTCTVMEYGYNETKNNQIAVGQKE